MSSFTKVCYCGRRSVAGTSRCERHPLPVQLQSERLESQPWRRAYQDPAYRRNRQRAWERDGGCCVVCLAPVVGSDWICDHVVALTDGGSNDLQNLQTLCTECSRVKTGRDRRRRATQS